MKPIGEAITVKVKVFENPQALGHAAAAFSASVLREAIAKNGQARLILSTGASQLDTIASLISEDVDWSKVTLFHLDEYIGLPENHPASFQKYLIERFLNHVTIGAVHFVDGKGNIEENIRSLTTEIRRSPIDLGLIGIGENAHLAFNDPPADFDTTEAFIVVNLDDDCKRQQVREGWFASQAEVPIQAITMTVHEIMQCQVIVSSMPYAVKAKAIHATLVDDEVTNLVPATMLKRHPNATVFLDTDSSSLLDASVLSRFGS